MPWKGSPPSGCHPGRTLEDAAGRSLALFEELKIKIQQIALHALPSLSKLGEASHYALNQWSRLKVFLENGRIEIDQNLLRECYADIGITFFMRRW